jgi:hypothetical protein
MAIFNSYVSLPEGNFISLHYKSPFNPGERMGLRPHAAAFCVSCGTSASPEATGIASVDHQAVDFQCNWFQFFMT